MVSGVFWDMFGMQFRRAPINENVGYECFMDTGNTHTDCCLPKWWCTVRNYCLAYIPSLWVQNVSPSQAYPNLNTFNNDTLPPWPPGQIPSHERGQAILKGLQVPSNGGYSPSPPVSIMMTSIGLKGIPTLTANRSALHQVMSWWKATNTSQWELMRLWFETQKMTYLRGFHWEVDPRWWWWWWWWKWRREPNPSNGRSSRPSNSCHFPKKRPCHTSSGNEGVLGNPKTNPLFKGEIRSKLHTVRLPGTWEKMEFHLSSMGLKQKNTPLICKEDPKRKRHDHQVFLNFLLFKSASTWDFVFSILQTCRFFYEPTSELVSHSQIEDVHSWGTWFKQTKSEKSTKRASPPKL